MTVQLRVNFVQIMLAAREEARRLNHSFIGVEHVFIALCRLGGFTERLLRLANKDPRAIRQSIRQVAQQHFVTQDRPGIHYTPRMRAILKSLDENAAEEMTAQISEPDLLKAIIQEGESIPIRVLHNNGIDLKAVLERHESAIGNDTNSPEGVHTKDDGADKYKELLRYGRDLTQLASENLIAPVIGREEEIRHLEQTLVRATKNNPVLLGEAGVGKTAIIEGLACLIAQGEVIPELRTKHIIEISLAQVTAGTKYRGAFEENLVKIIDVAKTDPDIILAIDELHTLVGTGGAEGGLDASNILKPALARGEIKLIGATTKDEYRKYIEPDAALERRFQRINVDEPSLDATMAILQGLRAHFEKHHHVEIEDQALDAALNLSAHFLPDRHLPDKAIDLLDEACAYARLHASAPDANVTQQQTLKVSDHDVTTVLTEWTGLPVEALSTEQRQWLLNMPTVLNERVIGQTHAVQVVTNFMEVALTGMHKKSGPQAVLLFVGPTGVGKTELAKGLAEFLFGSEKEMIRLDMSEYQERHQAAKLIGAPPGYIGHQEAGLLTESLRNKPYSVVLLDEVEKAHPDIFDVFLQLFDDGRLTDSHGKTADASHAIFIMTSNIGSELYDDSNQIGFGPATQPEHTAVRNKDILQECKKIFRPEFINRIDEVVVFEPLTQNHLEKIVEKMSNDLSEELKSQGIHISITPEAEMHIAKSGYEPMYGARPLRRCFERMIIQPLAHKSVKGEFAMGNHVTVFLDDGQLAFHQERIDGP